MSTVVTEFPTATRATKYDYTTLFDGQPRRLVQGEDFDVSLQSLRGVLYTRVAKINKDNPSEQIGLKTKFAVEDGVKVAYIQKIAPRVKAAKPAPAKKAAAPAAKKVTAKPAAKRVAPSKPVTAKA